MCILKFSKKKNSIHAMPLSITLLQMQHHHDLHQLTTNVKPPPYGAWLRARGSPWPNATHGAKKKHTRGLAFGKLKRCVKKSHWFNSKVGQEMVVFQQTVAFQEFNTPQQK